MIFERFLPTKKPEYQLWSSLGYFSLIDQLEKDQLNQSLTWDLISFFHEYVGMKDKKVYPYGEYGIMNAYHQKTSEACLKQEDVLRERGLDPTRAQLETKTALVVESWLNDPKTEISHKLVVISPRGTPEEGYPGLEEKHYVFINVYEKIEDMEESGKNEFQLVQYTSYAPETELSKLQQSLTNNLGGQVYRPQLPKLKEQPKIKSLSHHIIDQPILLNQGQTFEQIEKNIYLKEKKWTTTRNQLPKVPEDLFTIESTRVLDLLLTQFWLLAEATPNAAIISFDELVGVVREHFLKWVEHHATNYHPDKNLAPYALNLDLILENWQLAIKKRTQTISDEEKDKLKNLKKSMALDPLQPLLRASSVAHCIVGTPSSLAMQALKLNPSLISLNSPEFKILSHEDKMDLLQKIRSENMVEITLNNGETWMVPQSFLEGKGCYVDDKGVAMGPCDIPLSESFAFKMNLAEFINFVNELERQAFEPEIDEAQDELIEKFNLQGSEATELTEKINQIKKLIFKPVISITELISGDIVKNFHQNRDLTHIINQLRSSANPLSICETIIKKLLEDQNGVLSLQEV